MIEIIYPILGMFAGIIGGRVAAQYVLMVLEFRNDNHSLQSDFENDKMRRKFDRVCNTVLYELSQRQLNRSVEK